MASYAVPTDYGSMRASVYSPGEILPEGVPRAEAQPLLGPKPGPRARAAWQERMAVNVQAEWADTILLVLYTITGLLDSASTLTWGTFVSMQTGNTVYLGLGPSVSNNRWKKSGTSILAFCVGSFLFGHLHRSLSPSPRRRWVLCLSFMIQALLITAAACIVTWGPQSADPDDVSWYVMTPVALIAFQSCGQAVVSRAVKYNALTSVVLTSIYCDLFSDAELFRVSNAERNRRLAAPLSLLVGVVCGGLLAKSVWGTGGVLWIVAVIKVLLAIVWFLWPAEQSGTDRHE